MHRIAAKHRPAAGHETCSDGALVIVTGMGALLPAAHPIVVGVTGGFSWCM